MALVDLPKELSTQPVVKCILGLTQELGGDVNRNKKTLGEQYRAVVSEIYSPPRVTAAAARLTELDIDPGVAMDLTTTDELGEPWDFDIPRMREKARKLLRQQKPELFVGSPMCTAYSAWQRINKQRNPSAYRRKLRAARKHLEFVCELYAEQVKEGRLVLHEHPAQASSWDEGCIRRVRLMNGLTSIEMDQCQFGQQDREGKPVKTPTKWMSNSTDILDSIHKRCQGRGGVCSKTGTPHTTCNGRTAREAAIYPFQLCKAILEGLHQHLIRKGN